MVPGPFNFPFKHCAIQSWHNLLWPCVVVLKYDIYAMKYDIYTKKRLHVLEGPEMCKYCLYSFVSLEIVPLRWKTMYVPVSGSSNWKVLGLVWKLRYLSFCYQFGGWGDFYDVFFLVTGYSFGTVYWLIDPYATYPHMSSSRFSAENQMVIKSLIFVI
jgi:hypothetical protein